MYRAGDVRADYWGGCTVSSTTISDVLGWILLGWTYPIVGMAPDSPTSWRTFGIGVASTVFWSTIVGFALCEFTNAHAWLGGVVGL